MTELKQALQHSFQASPAANTCQNLTHMQYMNCNMNYDHAVEQRSYFVTSLCAYEVKFVVCRPSLAFSGRASNTLSCLGRCLAILVSQVRLAVKLPACTCILTLSLVQNAGQ